MQRTFISFCAIVFCITLVSALPRISRAKNPIAVVKTSLGTFECELYVDEAPKTVNNFVGLAKKKFFDGLRFHRIIKGFMIQGGDPNSKDPAKAAQWGMGGESIYGKAFEDELNPNTASYKRGYVPGVLAMANSGPNTNKSQFFVMAGSTALPHAYSIFGFVTKGLDVVMKIDNVPTLPGDRPKTDVMIESISIK